MKNMLIYFILFVPLYTVGQESQIGYWRDYLPYNNAISVAQIEGRVYVATQNSLFFLEVDGDFIERLTTINGLSDTGIKCMSKDHESNTLIIAYNSSKIDVLKNNTIYALLDIERENIIGGKSINSISFNSGKSYLSCSFGIVELDLENVEVLNTFRLNAEGSLGVNDVCFIGDSIYAGTGEGLFVAKVKDNLLDYRSWNQRVTNKSISKMETVFGKIYFTTDSLVNIYAYEPQGASKIKSVESLRFITKSNERCFVGTQGVLFELLENNNMTTIKESSYLYKITDVVVDNDNYWVSDEYRSLVKIKPNLSVSYFQPSGPISSLSFSTTIGNSNIFLSPGGVSVLWNNNNTYLGLNWFDGYNWNNIPYTSLANARDITNVVESADKTLFVATWNKGVLELGYDDLSNNYTLIKEHNYFTTNGALEAISTDTTNGAYGWVRVKDIVLDDGGLLWATCSGVSKGLAFMNNEGLWKSLRISSYDTENASLGDLIIDNQGKKWFYVAKGGGLIVYDDNGTPNNANDDFDRHLNKNTGSGGLPSNNIYSLAKDRDGEIWVGTDKGVAVFYNPENVFGVGSDAQLVLIETGGYVEPIMSNESVTSIAIDGANRKWFGTKNSGVFVYSSDGSQQIKHFTEENSPLFSNTINHIDINPKNGEVLISTEKGLISYKGEATEGQSTHENVIVYPNPVKENYYGPIAIKNVVEDANVKITDIAGNLIESMTAYGGQVVWDGKNKYDQRAATGVYLVFTTDPTGIETNVAKILFIK